MEKRGQQILAIFLIVLGGIYLAATFFNIDPGKLFWPLVFILLGAILIFRPKAIAPDHTRHYFAGDINLDENWSPQDQEIRMFAGDIDIDLGAIDLPAGETSYWVRFFAGDIHLDVPTDVGLRISATSFVVETKIYGESNTHVMTGYDYRSDNYDHAEKKFFLRVTSFAADIKVR